MALAPGTRLGPYEIVSPLGAGGMGEVYCARDTRLDRAVAIKILPEAVSSDPQRRLRFDREARAISALDTHPHICALHDIGDHTGLAFLVMQLVEGVTLADRLKTGALPIPEALTIAVQLADALDYAHSHGVVHRDLKPANVMLTRTGAMLLDFGLAKTTADRAGVTGSSADDSVSSMPTALADRTAAGEILGTLQYMPPEQLDGREADARADIFAFGAVLHEMLTGQKAFAGSSQAAIIGAILHVDPPTVSSIQPQSPPDLDRVVRTCLAKSPGERWQSARDLLRELQHIADRAGVGRGVHSTASVSRVPDRPSIAVLPFANLSGDAEQEYFVDGVVEDIITGLSRVRWLRVIARNSTFVYKGKAADVRQVGRDLGVRYVLEGSVRRAGDRVRLTTQLIEAASGAHLWADRYDRTIADIFALQDEITLSLVGVIEPTLREAEIQRARRKRPENMDAYDLYLRAMASLRVYMPGAADQALGYLRQALALQPDYPAAQAAAAWCHEVRYLRGGLHPSDKAAALEHAHAAIEAGADDTTTLATAGFVIGLVAHDYDTAMEVIDRSLTLVNASAFALGLGSIVLAHAGRTDSAIDYAQRALRLTPFGPDAANGYLGLATAHLAAGNFERAVEAASQAVRTNPRFSYAHALHAAALSSLGRVDDARAAMLRVIELEPQFTVAGFVRAHTGRPEIWEPVGRALSGAMP
jgi:TolB-like protein/Tfp pilus assembly protein PilF